MGYPPQGSPAAPMGYGGAYPPAQVNLHTTTTHTHTHTHKCGAVLKNIIYNIDITLFHWRGDMVSRSFPLVQEEKKLFLLVSIIRIHLIHLKVSAAFFVFSFHFEPILNLFKCQVVLMMWIISRSSLQSATNFLRLQTQWFVSCLTVTIYFLQPYWMACRWYWRMTNKIRQEGQQKQILWTIWGNLNLLLHGIMN